MNRDFPRFWAILGIPVIGLAGSLVHFIYQWSGKLTLVGALAPVNESVWEHLKLSFLPMLLWWLIGYLIFSKSKELSAVKWFTACAAAQLTSPVVILTFFYTYTGAFGIESLAIDIFSFFLAVAAGQVLALHIYRHARLNRYWLYISAAVIILIAATFILFTFIPPHIPLFKDGNTGMYGI